MYVQCVGMEVNELIRKVDAIHRSLLSKKKGLRWKARNVLGERMKWYEDVDAGTVLRSRMNPFSIRLLSKASVGQWYGQFFPKAFPKSCLVWQNIAQRIHF